MACLFVAGVPNFEIEREIVYIKTAGELKAETVAMPLATFRLGVAAGVDLLSKYDAAKAPVIRFRRETKP